MIRFNEFTLIDEKLGNISEPVNKFDAEHRLKMLADKSTDEVLQFIYNWVQGNKISVEVFKFLLTKTQSNYEKHE